MKRFSLIVACLIVSAPLMTSLAQAAPRSGGGARPAAARRPAAPRPAAAHAAARPATHPGAAHASPAHAKTAPAGSANGAKTGHPQTNAGKNGMPNNGGKNGGAQQNGKRYPGRGYRGFSSSFWLPAFAAFAFYNPDDATWYYWYEPSDSFLPVSYINDYPPVGPTGTNNNITPNVPAPLHQSLLPR
jgi:hypothetical protein